jgi:hypothetical protein
MRRFVSLFGSITLSLVSLGMVTGCGDDGETLPPLFEPRPECEGESIVPLQGQHQSVISFLEIGEVEDGFDLDGDGEPDNKLAAVGSLARSAIEDSFDDKEILIPFEFFDFDEPGVDDCVKFAIYLGVYKLDEDMDGAETATPGGDCNDHDDQIGPGMPEIPDNGKDDDCDGLADETEIEGDGGIMTVPSDDTSDADGDGWTIADGDCDDTNAMIHPGMTEICGDGLDNDCDGVADYGFDENGDQVCDPYDENPDLLQLDPLAFDDQGNPIIAFTSATVYEENGVLKLEAGPSVFSVQIPVTGDLSLDLRITGATILGDVVMTPAGWAIVNGRLGGVIDAHTADQIRGLEVDEIGLKPEDSLLDAIFANLLGAILALPSLPDDHEYSYCRTPDIDVDRDGLEAFCDSDLSDDKQTVDLCIDGDGTVYRDEVDADGNVTKHCTEFTDDEGNLLFVDGISVAINFDTTPAILPASLPMFLPRQ